MDGNLQETSDEAVEELLDVRLVREGDEGRDELGEEALELVAYVSLGNWDDGTDVGFRGEAKGRGCAGRARGRLAEVELVDEAEADVEVADGLALSGRDGGLGH